jgi:predicted  nucleic acid-binding Zn-ribbon protein
LHAEVTIAGGVFEMSEKIKNVVVFNTKDTVDLQRLPKPVRKPKDKTKASAQKSMPEKTVFKFRNLTKKNATLIKNPEQIYRDQERQLKVMEQMLADLHDRNEALGRPEWERRELEQKALLEDKIEVHLPSSELAKLDEAFFSLNKLSDALAEKMPAHILEKYSSNRLPKKARAAAEAIFSEMRKVDALIKQNRAQRNKLKVDIRKNSQKIAKLELAISRLRGEIAGKGRESVVKPVGVNKGSAAVEKKDDGTLTSRAWGLFDYIDNRVDYFEVSILDSK